MNETTNPIDSPELYEIIDELLRPDNVGDFQTRLVNAGPDAGFTSEDLENLLEVAIFIISQNQ